MKLRFLEILGVIASAIHLYTTAKENHFGHQIFVDILLIICLTVIIVHPTNYLYEWYTKPLQVESKDH